MTCPPKTIPAYAAKADGARNVASADEGEGAVGLRAFSALLAGGKLLGSEVSARGQGEVCFLSITSLPRTVFISGRPTRMSRLTRRCCRA